MTLNLRRLRAERVAKGLTQEDVSHKMGWKDRAAYAKRENGIVNIGANELIRIAEILGYSASELNIFFTNDVLEKERT